ncbi:MAG: hypothetical protein EBS55_14590, partial [Flavobacteriaceae bacterium]|nr:hypothetical protein [Flavobacteriaceae bacterium]
NLQYLKWSYESVRKNQGKHEVWMCYGVDYCTDGTLEWIQEIQKNDPFVKYIVNETGQRLGHTIMYDKIVYELVETDLAMIWHSDMYLCEGALDSIESLIQPNTIVSLTRIEPPLHPSGPEKIVMDFGTEPDNFNEASLIEFVKKQPKKQPTKGVFAPWAFWVDEFKSIGGHDFLFSPQSKEDCVKYDTLIFVEIGGYKQYITVNELWDRFAQNATIRNDGNYVLDLKSNDVYVLSPDSKTDGEFGLQRLNGLVRKVVDSSRMFDVRTNWGIVTVTDDHSLLDCETRPTKISNLNENCRLWKPKTIKRDRIRRKLLKSLNINGLQIDNIDEFGNPKHLIDICEFLGFFVAEGSITNKNYAISICQNNLET